MDNFELEIWNDECKRCTLYTVRWIDASTSETDKFFDKYATSSSEFAEDAYILSELIQEAIGNKYGAIDDFFNREERHAMALPPKHNNKIVEIEEIGPNFPLRLFCYRVSQSIVILINGGLKTAKTAQESQLSFFFHQAQSICLRVQEAFNDGIIFTSKNGRYIQDDQNSENIVL